MRILLIEDEPEMASVLKTALERQDLVVDHVSTLADAEAMARLGTFDAVVLDRRLPDGDGLGLIPRLRALHVDAPVIALTAMSGLDDRVSGLNAGADDYMVKPFAIEELMARLRALHRRQFTVRAEQAVVGRLTYDFRHREALVEDQALELPRRERLVLETLIRRPGRAIMRSSLEEAVYALDDEIGSNALDAHISRLRRKLDDVAAGIEIRAIRNIGYLLRAAP
ncbi:response regulator transcription factor [Mesorhizobium sp. WSM4303]|uniref:response regulator transcription factor n=1 Tax=unclassified Mesorhizobium TaxID=325217 RepID=UPI00115DFB13|nr:MULTISPECIES: response regulator transcription factor [unclassified Mesorhizobium]TRC94263.1 response regulator transcription factor [Mesorhizobium sp. WSM4306]TRD07245.1 response regulator transcription factor [Mesorhizobium sp. WSM4303]